MAQSAANEPTWQVGPAGPADLPALAPIWRSMMQARHHLAPAFDLRRDATARWRVEMLNLLAAPQCFVLVARLGTAVHHLTPAAAVASVVAAPATSAPLRAAAVGYCSGWWNLPPPIYTPSRCGTLNELAVASAFMRQGLGQKLLAAAMQWFRQQRVQTFELSCALENHNARRFWRQQGGKEMMIRYHFGISCR